MLQWRHEPTSLEIIAEKQQKARFQRAGWLRRLGIGFVEALRLVPAIVALVAGMLVWLLIGASKSTSGRTALLLGIGVSVGIYTLAHYLLDRVEDRLD